MNPQLVVISVAAGDINGLPDKETTDALVADFMWNVIEDIKNDWQFLNGTDWSKLGVELAAVAA